MGPPVLLMDEPTASPIRPVGATWPRRCAGLQAKAGPSSSRVHDQDFARAFVSRVLTMQDGD
jgi:ABC-type sulfate/molybdate transport systems ATPase subunit